MAIEYTPESSLVADPAEGGSFSTSSDAELAGAQSFAAKAKLAQIAAELAETNAENSATSASGAASTASNFATNASNSATASANSATDASDFATNAADSATASADSATASAGSATASAGSATNAAGSATTAAGSATTAAGSATAASDSATASANSAITSADSATDSANSATASAGSATTAAGSATTAAGSATTAAGSATAAAGSATAASDSATDSANSATTSGNSATTSANSATAASNSETAAAGSATTSANSATASANSATASAGSATNSSNSATSAATAQTAAEAARDAALAAFDSFDDRYLGAKASDPTTDNDGDALAAGMLYYNTTDDVMKVYEGSSWVAAYASLSGALIANNNLSDLNSAATARTNLGLGTIATAAATDYVPTTGGTFTGNVESPEFIGTLQGEVVFKAKAGEAITKGDAVYVSGISGNTPVVSKADSDDAAKMPAFGLSADTVSANAAMEVVILGQLTHMDTSGYTLGDTLYISNTPGVLSATKPAGESSQLQNIGKVERVHASTGSILVSGSGRSAATPNLNDGQFFLGNGSNQAASTDFTTSVLGEISAGTGIGISGGGVISNSEPDQTVSLTGGTGISTSGTYPNFTITNDSPDQTVSLTGAGATTISGTYPNFTITSSGTTYTAGTGITLTGAEFSIGQGVATTDSPAFAGLTVDTDTLAVDSTNNRVGIGTTSPSAPLHVQKGSAGSSAFPSGDWAAKIFNQTDASTEHGLVVANRWQNDASTAFEVGGLLDDGNGFDTWMKVTGGGNVGIGTTSPVTPVHVQSADNAILMVESTDAKATVSFKDDTTTNFFGVSVGAIGDNLIFQSGSDSNEDMRLDSSGRLGIGITSPAAPLHIDSDSIPMVKLDNNTNTTNQQFQIYNGNTYPSFFGINTWANTNRFHQYGSNGTGGNFTFNHGTSAESMRITSGKRVGIGTTGPAATLHVVGSIVATGNITAYYSDERLKDLKGTIKNPLEKLNTLNGYYYTPNEKAILEGAEWNGLEVGVSAQEVEKVLPEVIRPSAIGKDYKTVAYEKLTPLLIEAVKELSEKVDKLESRLDELEK